MNNIHQKSSKLYLKDGSFQWHFPKNTPSLFKPNKKFPSLLPPPTTVIYNTKTAYYLEEKEKKKTSCQKFWPEIKKKLFLLYISNITSSTFLCFFFVSWLNDIVEPLLWEYKPVVNIVKINLCFLIIRIVEILQQK